MLARHLLSLSMLALLLIASGPAPDAHTSLMSTVAASAVSQRWQWPLPGPPLVSEPFRAPPHAYGAGHRGVDAPATVGTVVRAPASGVVAFRGTVVDRPLITITHADGYVSTYEPLDSTLSVGDSIAPGDVIGTVSSGGHAEIGSIHIGVRLNGEYMDPMRLFGLAERAVLLPCCDPL